MHRHLIGSRPKFGRVMIGNSELMIVQTRAHPIHTPITIIEDRIDRRLTCTLAVHKGTLLIEGKEQV